MDVLYVARSYKTKNTRNHVTDETINLALAWARGEIGVAAVLHAMGHHKTDGGSAAYSLLARSLAEHVRRSG